MNSLTALTGSHLRTYHSIFRQAVAPNLGWLAGHPLFRHPGLVEVDRDFAPAGRPPR